MTYLVFIDRKRALIYQPTYSSCPISWAREYFQGQLRAFRKKHPQFDCFLREIGKELENEKSKDYQRIIKFINGEAETNWICTRNSIFSVFIELFNLCLSPDQAVSYIKKCHLEYLKMLRDKYRLSKEYEIILSRSRYDGLVKKHVMLKVLPATDNHHLEYSYKISISPLLLDNEDLSLSSNVDIELLSSNPIYQHAFSLFEYYSYEKLPRSVLRNVYNVTIFDLKQHGIFEYVGKEERIGRTAYNYNIIGDVGLHIIK